MYILLKSVCVCACACAGVCLTYRDKTHAMWLSLQPMHHPPGQALRRQAPGGGFSTISSCGKQFSGPCLQAGHMWLGEWPTSAAFPPGPGRRRKCSDMAGVCQKGSVCACLCACVWAFACSCEDPRVLSVSVWSECLCASAVCANVALWASGLLVSLYACVIACV